MTLTVSLFARQQNVIPASPGTGTASALVYSDFAAGSLTYILRVARDWPAGDRMRECLLSGPGHLSVGCFASGAKLALTLGSWLSLRPALLENALSRLFLPRSLPLGGDVVTFSHFRAFRHCEKWKAVEERAAIGWGEKRRGRSRFCGGEAERGPFFFPPLRGCWGTRPWKCRNHLLGW